MEPSPVAIAERTAPAEQVFRGVLAGQPVHLVVHDCEVFLARPGFGGEVAWEPVLAPDPYPFWTSCERQRLTSEAGGVTAELGRRAFGAGGCCATGGTFHSTDGRTWKKRLR